MEDILSDLIREGIIVETFHPVSPLCGLPLTESGQGWQVQFPPSQFPLLAFTHSLLHDYLANRATPKMSALLQLISQDAPLYSLLPLRLIETKELPPDTDIEIIRLVFQRVAAIAQALDRTANWRDASDLLGALKKLAKHLEQHDDSTPEAAYQWQVHTTHVSLTILRRSMQTPGVGGPP